MNPFMRQVLALASSCRGYASPNPAVACILVKKGKIIARGVHRKTGEAHAEVIALNKAGSRARGATLYINLEPCCHYGRTPPCTAQIIRHGVKEVYAAIRDPNPLVNGGGIKELRRAGIPVHMGLGKEQAGSINESYLKYITRGKPFVHLKTALSLDGRIAAADGSSRWISNPSARQYGHFLRNIYDAILIGKGTLLNDNPHLNVRYINNPRQPLRIILTRKIDFSFSDFQLMNIYRSPGKILIVADEQYINFGTIREFEEGNVTILAVPSVDNRLCLDILLRYLASHDLISVLVEGGSFTITEFLKQNLADKLTLVICPLLLGDAALPLFHDTAINSMERALKFRKTEFKKIKDNLIVNAYPLFPEV
ncbi:MAG: bifunctional diaminohydroxyphosphoribosylaminopyrimidine deaminase/5-amino-6-(5-phosphoribosylamino)uracil reductase RibD [Candidatus Cloacimonetes bacterium]|nr:bifunctional diaminohydroxyphosphoribosylaminopyrimidine deaminase/5-amino-6-(5-phosphoribosylamino)uracil reductase RibD [Candidatus Cloacimonadota bacterium]